MTAMCLGENFAALILGAGLSTRMAGGGKLTKPLGGKPLVRWTVENFLKAGFEDVHMVINPEGRGVREALVGLPVLFHENPHPDKGMASSLSIGVSGLPHTVRHLAVTPADMPFTLPSTISELAKLSAVSVRGIVVPIHKGVRGHPVFFSLAKYRRELENQTGDKGARALLELHRGDVLEMLVDDPGVHLDVDTEEALLLAERFLSGLKDSK